MPSTPIDAASGTSSSAYLWLEFHGDPEQWLSIANQIKQSTTLTVALLELNLLDNHYQQELDCQELWEFHQCQPLFPGSVVPLSPPLAHGPSPLPPPSIPKKQKRPVKLNPGSKGSSGLRRQVVPSGSSEQFAPPNTVEDLFRMRIKTPSKQQCSQEPLRPYPRSQATSALKAENDRLKAEVEELRTLLTQAQGQNSTLTSLLCDTSSSLDLCSKELEASRRSLEEVAVEHEEYQRVLTQFQAIEAELPEPPSEDILIRFYIAQSEVGISKEVARKQKQEIAELRKQVADVEQHSFDAYAELDSANACAMQQRDRLEELEDMVCQYRDRAHVAKGLIRQYPEDKGLNEVELPSLSELQRKLDASEALHAGFVDARPDSVEPPLQIPLPPTPTLDHLPVVPAMDSIMVTWERLIVNYIRDMIDPPGPRYRFPTSLESLGSAGEPITATEDDEDTPMVGDEPPVPPSIEGSTEIGPRGEVTALEEGQDEEFLVENPEDSSSHVSKLQFVLFKIIHIVTNIEMDSSQLLEYLAKLSVPAMPPPPPTPVVHCTGSSGPSSMSIKEILISLGDLLACTGFFNCSKTCVIRRDKEKIQIVTQGDTCTKLVKVAVEFCVPQIVVYSITQSMYECKFDELMLRPYAFRCVPAPLKIKLQIMS
ncbi:hypothetical protein F5876DRAFT_69898 [Lentinula aff. lateritia]|uniref:Uncharacterized protein n=1 Tax=Lentinula aff. lateritia TaxID=2804960 RepID=A0ACC1TL41_9AGAR|nr:hypothetical protein F5876DRAFT_69898 [Lentinula aff. lateritia]